MDGIPTDQSGSENFQMHAGRRAAGMFAGTFLEEFGREPQADKTTSSRASAQRSICSARPRPDSRRLGHLHRFRLHRLERAHARARRRRHRRLRDCPSTRSDTASSKAAGSFFRRSRDPLRHLAGASDCRSSAPDDWRSRVAAAGAAVLVRPTSAGRTRSIAARRSAVDYVRVQGRNLNMRVRPNSIPIRAGPRCAT